MLCRRKGVLNLVSAFLRGNGLEPGEGGCGFLEIISGVGYVRAGCEAPHVLWESLSDALCQEKTKMEYVDRSRLVWRLKD